MWKTLVSSQPASQAEHFDIQLLFVKPLKLYFEATLSKSLSKYLLFQTQVITATITPIFFKLYVQWGWNADGCKTCHSVSYLTYRPIHDSMELITSKIRLNNGA